uniref:Uncharacterized protein n=1 Tax=Brassica oleracea TaxID=3712 RepID=A0A3P6BE73_BRAOL|nr:unnamed protein product [Brassica oleracea]
MGDRDQEKNMENPDTVQKVCLADHNQTAILDTGRLCGCSNSTLDWAVGLNG